MKNYVMSFELFEKISYKDPNETIKQKQEKIMRLRKIPKELKEEACKHVIELTNYSPKKITSLSLHPDLKKKIKEKSLPDGFHMGIDKDGYFVHTHRARCKSFKSPEKIGVKEIKFIDSTG